MKQPKYKGTFPGGSGNPMDTSIPSANMGAGEIDSPVESMKARSSQMKIENLKPNHPSIQKMVNSGRRSGRYPGGTGKAMG